MILNGQYRDFPKLGVPFWGPHIKDYGKLGSTLGSLFLGNHHIVFLLRIRGLGFKVEGLILLILKFLHDRTA